MTTHKTSEPRSQRRRGHGEGTIGKRKDGRWEAKITLNYEGGKRSRRALYGKTRAEVRDKLVSAQKAKHDGMRMPSESITFGAYLAEWLETSKQRVRPGTWKRYEQYVRLHAEPALGRVKLARLSQQHLQRLYTAKLSAGLSPTTVLHLHRMLHLVLKHAARADLVVRNVADFVDPPRMRHTEMRTYSMEEVRQLFAVIVGDRLEALYVLAVTTGMRQGELLGLRWRDVSLPEGRTGVGSVQVRMSLQPALDNSLQLVETKTSKSRRQIELSNTATAALKRHRAKAKAEALASEGDSWSEDLLVFTNTIGGPIKVNNLIQRHYRPMLERAGLPRLRFHDLRHTAATLLLAENVNPKIVSEMLGHTTVGITLDLYSHVTPTMQRAAAEAMDNLCARPSAELQE